jgi:hypothetical protein
VENWYPRDNCVWCLEPNGAGNCRPGNDYGMCATADPQDQALFALKMKALCGASTICRLTYNFPELGTLLSVPTTSPTSQPSHRPATPTLSTNSPNPVRFVCSSVMTGTSAAAAKSLCAKQPSCKWYQSKCVPVHPING